MIPAIDFQSHFRKSFSHEINNSFKKQESYTKIIYNQNNKTNTNSKRIRTPFHEENKNNNLLKIQGSSNEQRQSNRNRKYTSNTHNPLLIINNRMNKEENEKNENNNNTSIYFQKMKRTLNNQYNLSDNNLLKNKKSENRYSSNLDHQNNRKNNQLSLDLNPKSDIKYLINEELNNKMAKNLQTKTTIVLRIKNTQNAQNTQNDNRQITEPNRRLNLKSVEPQKKNINTVYYSSYSNSNTNHNKTGTKKNIRQNSTNNHNIYTSKYTRRNKNQTNTTNTSINTTNITTNNTGQKPSNNISNNITTINTQSTPKRNHEIKIIKNNRENEKEKKNEKDKNKINKKPKDFSNKDYHIKKPNITITSTYNNSTTSNNINNNINNNSEEEEEENNIQNNTIPSSMFDEDEEFGEMKTPIKLSPEIFGLYHPKFKTSIHSLDYEFKNNDDLIKAYAYNTSEGNIRDYNEDTITVTKINLNPKEKNNYCYFFAVYDGHGGNGCSLYLKNNLHKNITEFSTKGLKTAIELTENNFLNTKALDYNSNPKDTSGSCAIILLIKNKKCIIANIGDSRLVIFKNKKVVFSTSDHKPNTYIEKRRIETAGGTVYQTTAAIPIYQNGKLIEIPWRVYPGGLSVSRTFGDIESKDERFGGKKGVVIALPDINEFDLNEEYNFIVIGCDGIFDVLSNGEIIECIKIVLNINKGKNKKINDLCGDFASMIIKSALAKESFDNVSCVVIVFNLKDFI